MDEQDQVTTKKINGHIHKITPIIDKVGNIIHHSVKSFQIELTFHDIFQIAVGAYILTIPVSLTEEVWVLTEQLALRKILYLGALSIFFIACFVYSHSFRGHLKENWIHFINRIIATYFVSLFAVGLFLTLIDKCPWGTDNILAIKRLVFIAFPASMAATISDSMK